MSTRVIILAAGRGARLLPHTRDRPKCMLPLGDKTLLQWQLEAYRACGIDDICVVRGYRAEALECEGLRTFDNPDFERNNVLASLFCAEDALEGHVIAAYSDIVFEPAVVRALLRSRADISLVVDTAWRASYVGRTDHPLEEAEKVVFDDARSVVSIGKALPPRAEVCGEFIGMMKLTPRGAALLKRHFHRARAVCRDGPFQRASRFRAAYLTDLLQEMVDSGVRVHCVAIEGGWREIDTAQDYARATLAAQALRPGRSRVINVMCVSDAPP